MKQLFATLRSPSRWPAAWESYWFPEAPAVRLSVMRIIIVALQLTWFDHPLGMHRRLIEGNDQFHEPQLIVSLIAAVVGEETLRSVATFELIHATWMITGLLALIGLLTRPAMLVFAFLNLLLISHQYSYGEHHHPEAIYTLFVLLMAFAPCNAVLSVDAWIAKRRGLTGPTADGPPRFGLGAVRRSVMWPILLTQWLLCLAYLNAGTAKLWVGGLDWLNGVTLQNHLLQDGLRWDRPLGVWMAKQHTLCVIASYGAVGLEVFFFLVMIFRRLAPLFILGGIMMHVGIFVMQAAPFWQFIVLYLMWVPWERIPGLDGGARAVALGASSAKLA